MKRTVFISPFLVLLVVSLVSCGVATLSSHGPSRSKPLAGLAGTYTPSSVSVGKFSVSDVIELNSSGDSPTLYVSVTNISSSPIGRALPAPDYGSEDWYLRVLFKDSSGTVIWTYEVQFAGEPGYYLGAYSGPIQPGETRRFDTCVWNFDTLPQGAVSYEITIYMKQYHPL